MSKGSKQRPKQVSNDEYAHRWDAIFGVHTEDEPEEMQEETKEETDDNS
jgi:hypothetical protein